MLMSLKKIDNLSNLSYIILVTFLTFLLWYLFLGFKVINQPYIWDDLHLIRSYSLIELINTWLGNWDSAGVETPSYRPVAILYYNIIGVIFGENFFLLRIFIFLLMICLISQFNLILSKLGFNRIQILIFSLLIVFTKIYSTLLSFITLSALIFCYILALFSIILFIRWLENRKNELLFFSIFFAFLSIFTRETMYILPGIFCLILVYKQKKYFLNFKKNLLIILPFFLIVLIHIVLRKIFVVEASHFDLSLGSIKFGGEEISIGSFVKTFKSSWLPMGYWSVNKFYILQTVTFFTWIVSLCIGLLINIKYIDLTKLKLFNCSIFFLTLFLLCLPSITTARSFGIMLPSLIIFSFISVMISNLLTIKSFYSNKKILKFICNSIIILTVLSVFFGGYFRSNEHIKTMNIYSARIVYFDSLFIYHEEHQDIKIPKIRYEKKIKHLENLNIFNREDAKNFHKQSNSKIYVSKFGPLEF
jgi:hypothetical protein